MSHHKLAGLAICASLALTPFPGQAETLNHVKPVKTYLQNQLLAKIVVDEVIAAIREQNKMNAGLKQGDIDALDGQWRSEVETGAGALIARVMGSDVSKYLKSIQNGEAGIITELFIMDNRGLNVAQSEVTSDYWQGDESKFQKSFGAGAGAIFVDEVEFDESTQRFQTQGSFTITDPDSGEPIGAVTVGIDMEMIEQVN